MALHIVVILQLTPIEIVPVVNQGAFTAPVNLSFSLVNQASAKSLPDQRSEETPEITEITDAPETSITPEDPKVPEVIEVPDTIVEAGPGIELPKVADTPPPKKTPKEKTPTQEIQSTSPAKTVQAPEPVIQEESPEPEQVTEESDAAMISAIQESSTQGLNEVPELTEPAFRSPPAPPNYPRRARKQSQEGTVLVEVWIDSGGEILSVEIIDSSGFPLLDREAIRAVSQWDFQPRISGTKAVQSRVQIPVNFELQNS